MRAFLARAVQSVLQSRRRIWIAVVGTGVFFCLFEFAVSQWLIRSKLPTNLHAALQAFIVGLLGMVERRKMLEDELRRLAELNHSVRNSLELILLANYSNVDRERKALVLECTSRIDQKLRELFPALRKDRQTTAGATQKGEGPGRTRASNE
jgi:uncharacterized membrane protein YcjF (UPF0283 family)